MRIVRALDVIIRAHVVKKLEMYSYTHIYIYTESKYIHSHRHNTIYIHTRREIIYIYTRRARCHVVYSRVGLLVATAIMSGLGASYVNP